MAEVESRYQSKWIDSSRQLRERTRTLAAREAETMIRSFAAGLYPMLRSDRRDDVDAAVGEIVKLPEVVFVHVLEPDGQVVATSDRKLEVAGQTGPRAAWALGTKDFRARDGAPGVLEVALSVVELSGGSLILWMGFETGEAPPIEELESQEL